MTAPPPASGDPTFSVVVPTYRRPPQLVRCLQAIAAQDYPHPAFEVVVVDDGADEGTKQAIDEFVAKHDFPVRLIVQPAQSGPAAARNAGAAVAVGKYLAFTDDDCEPDHGWLTGLGRHLAAQPAAAVGGPIVNSIPSVPYSTASQMLIDYLYDYYRVDVTGARFFTSNNLAVSAAAFAEVGRFDDSFPLAAAEDREFCERWQRGGRTLVYAGDAVVRHGHRLTFQTFLRQHFNYGRGADFLHRSRARHGATGVRPKLEPPSFYINLLLFPLARKRTWRSIPLVGLFCLSQAAYAAGYFVERLRSGRGR